MYLSAAAGILLTSGPGQKKENVPPNYYFFIELKVSYQN